MAVKNFDVMNLGKAGLLNPEQAGYKDSIEIIKDESFRVQKSFVKIGWYLKHIRDNELFKEDGYASIWECAADQLGYSQATVSRFINICEKFSKNHNSPELDVKYAGFDKSQMIEMLPMEPEQLEKITPEMTVKQIREVKAGDKTLKEPEPETEEDIPGQTSIEKDFPEYMPKEQEEDLEEVKTEVYATSHKEAETYCSPEAGMLSDETEIIDGEYQEIEKLEEMPVAEENLSTYGLPNVSVQEPEELIQSELPMLKNNDQRKEWLEQYKEWGLWYRDENIDVNYYKYDFKDGSRLVVAEYPQRQCYWKKNKIEDEYFYHLLQVGKEGYEFKYNEKYRASTDSETYLVEFLKNLQKKEPAG